MSSRELLERARAFIYNNARLLDRRRYEYHFEGGTKKAVLSALQAYQNPDGGFGHALEPDIRCPQSQPVPTEMALHILDEVDGFDSPILDGIANYLQRIALPNGGFPLVFRDAQTYPHAPWWKTDSDAAPSINPTGTILGLLYKQTARPEIVREPWFERSVRYVWRQFETTEPHHYHDGVQWIHFLRHTPERERAAEAARVLDGWLRLPTTIERNPDAEGYVQKVLDWAPSPDSYARKFVSEADVERHLNALIRQQREDGGWPLSFAAVSPAGESEWRGLLAVDRLRTIKSYGVL